MNYKSANAIAVAFLVLCGVQLSSAQVQPQSKAQLGGLAGRVTIEDRPASGLVLELMPRRGNIKDPPIATTVTDEDGQYRFSEVPASHYYVKVDAPDYVSEDFDFEGPGRPVSVATSRTLQHVDIELIPGGIISGRIVDQDGFPVRDEAVDLIRPIGLPYAAESIFLKRGNQHTDYDGSFRVTGIRPGSYWIAVGVDIGRLTGATYYKNDFGAADGRVEGRRYFEQTFYPGVTNRESAQAVEIKSGEEVSGLNMTVRRPHRAYSVSGRVVNQSTGGPITLCYLEVGYKSSRGGFSSSHRTGGTSDTDANGQFTITGLMPGRFFIRVHLPQETGLYGPPEEFDISDNDISDFEIKVRAGVTVSGWVVIEGDGGKDAASKFSGLKLSASQAGALGSANREANVNQDGSFAITALPVDDVALQITPFDSGRYFSLARVEYPVAGQNAIQVIPVKKEPLTSRMTTYLSIPNEGIKNLRVIVAYHNGSIKCHVNFLGGKLPIDNRYSLNITRYGANQSLSTTDLHLDPDGNTLLDGLEPGEYEICLRNANDYLDQTRRKIVVEKNKEARVSFTVHLK